MRKNDLQILKQIFSGEKKLSNAAFELAADKIMDNGFIAAQKFRKKCLRGKMIRSIHEYGSMYMVTLTDEAAEKIKKLK